MHILFVAPEFPAAQADFVRALASVGARVTGIGERPYDWLGHDMKSWLYGYEQVRSVTHEPSLLDAVRRVQQREWVDRLEATIEAHILPTANVRKATGIPGLSPETALLCRDKPKMKAFLRERNIPCARSTDATTTEEVAAFADEVGYPLIVKPRDGAGAAGTVRIDSADDLPRAAPTLAAGGSDGAAVEEYMEGHEGFYDTLTVGGVVVHEFVSHYYPNVLEAMRTRWISPQIVVTNRVGASGYDELRELGRRVIDEMNIATAATHMEWFFGPKGLKFSEIGARPPGVSQWDLYCAANEIDLYREWAFAITTGQAPGRLSRRYSAGIIALRPDRDGRISHYEGVDAIHARYGDYIIDAHLPPTGTPTQPVEAGYMANAWVRMRHPDYDKLRAMLDDVGETMQVRAS